MGSKSLIAALLVTSALGGCASSPPPRTESVSLPPLQEGLSRVYMTAGKMGGYKLWSTHQVGPMYVNGELVGNSAKNEQLVVDLTPGEYQASCSPEAPDKNFVDKRTFTFKPGETRYLACNMQNKGAGAYLGLIGALASTYLTETFFADEPLDPASRIVGYKTLVSTPTQVSQAR